MLRLNYIYDFTFTCVLSVLIFVLLLYFGSLSVRSCCHNYKGGDKGLRDSWYLDILFLISNYLTTR